MDRTVEELTHETGLLLKDNMQLKKAYDDLHIQVELMKAVVSAAHKCYFEYNLKDDEDRQKDFDKLGDELYALRKTGYRP